MALGSCWLLAILLACRLSAIRRVLNVYLSFLIAWVLLGPLTNFGKNWQFFGWLLGGGLLEIFSIWLRNREQQQIDSGVQAFFQAIFTSRVVPAMQNTYYGPVNNSNIENKTTTTTTGNITNSNIGAVGFAKDASVFIRDIDSSHLNLTEKEALKTANDELERLPLNSPSKDDVREDLSKIAQELHQQQPDEGRLKHLLKSIKDIAPSVASALSIAASLAKLLG